MIPTFPEFKPLTVGDRHNIETHTHKFEPYSDFNFFSLWAWDTKEKRMISEHNGNLVVLMTEYNTGEPLLSFLGTNKPNETALALLEYAVENKISPILRYVPEVSVEEIENPILKIQEDRGDFDYIYSTSELSTLAGNKYKNKRQLYKWFRNDNPEAIFVQKDIVDSSNKSEIETIMDKWERNKQADGKECDLKHERIAVDRLLAVTDKDKLTVSSVRLNDTIVSFSIDEIIPGGYAISHFCKSDSTYRGAYDYLNVQITTKLLERDTVSWNWEQDLDLESLRNAKMHYGPVSFLKKFSVELTT